MILLVFMFITFLLLLKMFHVSMGTVINSTMTQNTTVNPSYYKNVKSSLVLLWYFRYILGY